MNPLTRRNVTYPFSNEQTNPAFVNVRSTTRDRGEINKLKNIMLSNKEMHVFNYSIPEMKKAISSKSELVPAINNLEDLENWLSS